MAATPTQIRTALAAQITANVLLNGTIPPLRGLTDPQTVANPPVAVVLAAQAQYIDYEKALGTDAYDINLRIVIIVSRAHERAMLPVLDAYLSPNGASSVVAAILKDPTLGGVCDWCVPTTANGPADIVWNDIDYLSAEVLCTAAAE